MCVDTAAGIIDPDYRGELKVVLVNNGHQDIESQARDKIAQLICEKCKVVPVQEADVLNDTTRG